MSVERLSEILIIINGEDTRQLIMNDVNLSPFLKKMNVDFDKHELAITIDTTNLDMTVSQKSLPWY